MIGKLIAWLVGSYKPALPPSEIRPLRHALSANPNESKLDDFAPLKENDRPEESSSHDQQIAGQSAESADGDIQSFICREPMLDNSSRMAGYEFLLRKSPTSNVRHETPAVLRLYDEVLIRNVTDMDIGRLLGSRLAFVGISPGSIGCRLFDLMPKMGVVLVIRTSSALLDEAEAVAIGSKSVALDQVKHLKEEGFLIALEGFSDAPEMTQFIQVADFGIVDTLSEDPQHLSALVDSLRKKNPEIRLIAKNIESTETYEAYRKLSFTFFQGPFLTRLEEQEQPKVSTNHVHLFEILNLIQKDADPAELVKVFKLDPTLTYKFLRYINSAGGGLVMKVPSIDRAITVLGQKKLYRWLTLLLYGTGNVNQKDWALMENAMIRGRMTETLGREAFSASELDNLFIVGFFSLLDVLLRMPMGQALAQINLPDELIQALVHKEGKYAPYLELAIACEQFDPNRIAELATVCKLDVQKVNLAHMDAMLWAMEVEQ